MLGSSLTPGLLLPRDAKVDYQNICCSVLPCNVAMFLKEAVSKLACSLTCMGVDNNSNKIWYDLAIL